MASPTTTSRPGAPWRSSRRPRAIVPLRGLPRRYGVWSRPSTTTVLCAAVPLNQWRRFGDLLVVGVAARVEDERAPVGGDLDVEQVVVAVAAVAERAAVEDQPALVGERAAAVAPAAALDVVAARAEAHVPAGGRLAGGARGGGPAQVLAVEEVGGELEQLGVVAAVAVAERRDRPVGAVAVQRELARAREVLVVAVGAARARSGGRSRARRANERSDDAVVVRRAARGARRRAGCRP